MSSSLWKELQPPAIAAVLDESLLGKEQIGRFGVLSQQYYYCINCIAPIKMWAESANTLSQHRLCSSLFAKWYTHTCSSCGLFYTDSDLWWAAAGNPPATDVSPSVGLFVWPRAAVKTHHGRKDRKVMQLWWILPPWRNGNLHSLPLVVKTVTS